MLRQLLAQVARDNDAVDRVRADGVGVIARLPRPTTSTEASGISGSTPRSSSASVCAAFSNCIVLAPQQRVEREGVVVANRFT